MKQPIFQDAVSVLITIAVAFAVISLIVLVNKVAQDDKLKA